MKKAPIILVSVYLLISCMVAVGFQCAEKSTEEVQEAWNEAPFFAMPSTEVAASGATETPDVLRMPDEVKMPDAAVTDVADTLNVPEKPNAPEEPDTNGESGVIEKPVLTEEPDAVVTLASSSAVLDATEENRVNVTYNGKVIGFYNTDYRMDEDTLDEIVAMVRKEPYISSFVLYDINSDAMICYNEERYYPVASTVKAPFAMTCLKQIEEDVHSFEDTVEYTSEYAIGGDGVIKKDEIGTVYTVKELIEHAILVSDDIAYLLLQDRFGHKTYNGFLKELGNKVTIDGAYVKWGKTSAMDSLRNWKEVYRYITSESANAEFFAELLKNTNRSYIRNVLGEEYEVYNKMGWVYGQCCHDHAIVMDEQPYLMMIMTMGDARKENQKFVETLAGILNDVHEEMVNE